MLPVLFLDIDSVLNAATDSEVASVRPAFSDIHIIHMRKLRLVAEFCQANKVDVVITSDWRRTDRLRSWLRSMGNRHNLNIVGFTPELEEREDEIRAYISEHGVSAYAILDDINLLIENFVHVDHTTGVTQENLDSCVRFLFPNGVQNE